tara:strand:+ start:266 stop:589 length:324 start_codon:yes stop_codon:yes gene_type:complete
MREPAEKVVFYDTEKRKAELKIKLHNDGLSQAHFFRSVISAYISEDNSFMGWFEKYFTKNSTIKNKTLQNKALKQKRNAKKVEQAFNLNDDEIENIFDLLEQEHPEL